MQIVLMLIKSQSVTKAQTNCSVSFIALFRLFQQTITKIQGWNEKYGIYEKTLSIVESI